MAFKDVGNSKEVEKILHQNGKVCTSSKRDENSLFLLTKKFIKLLVSSPDQTINIRTAAQILQVSKRRIYDITNVLEGIDFIAKWSVNSVKWVGSNANEILRENTEENFEENKSNIIIKEEKEIESEIEKLNIDLSILSSSKKKLENAYVTYNDIKNMELFKNKLIFAIKAPDETMVEYPKYQKGCFRMKASTEKGKISVFYVENEK